jgi:riboflavin kinase/FMN adenylyltransferase
MKLINGQGDLSGFNQGVVATIGNFDGVHLGHQELIRRVREKGLSMGLPLVVILFEPQPKEYFQGKNAPSRLSSLREKLLVLKDYEVDYVYCIKFTRRIAGYPASEFVSDYLLNKLNIRYLVVGDDFKFGRNREGTVHLLKQWCQPSCEVELYPAVYLNDDRISSTKIRQLVHQGDLQQASQLLGRNYSLCGRVIKGDGRGRQWGIPTANIGLHRFALPCAGVFVVEVRLQSKILKGVANLGNRPTVDGTKNTLEIHLFNFNESIYGELVQVFFLYQLRHEIKFSSVDALIEQIRNDISAAHDYLDLSHCTVNAF